METKKKIHGILDKLYQDIITEEQAVEQILLLFSVVGQGEQLLAFCDHLNTYNGMEEIRFDFIMQDFIDKSK